MIPGAFHPFAKISACVGVYAGLFLSVVFAANLNSVALGQDANAERTPSPLSTKTLGMTGWRNDPITIRTQTLEMTGWQPDPITTIRTSTLGMTGWQRDPTTVRTYPLAMTGWRNDPITIDAHVLGLTGWRRHPATITSGALGMTGWANTPERCSAPFLLDSDREECTCAPGLLPFAGKCIAENASPPHDLRIEIDGSDSCRSRKTCQFDIVIANIGTGPFQGPLFVLAHVNVPDAELSTSSSGWSCVAGSCVHPRVTLAPGGNEGITITALMPSGVRRDFRVKQCAELKAPGPGDEPIRFVQLMLTAAGIDAGPPDNQMGQRTRGGIESFRRTVGLPTGSEIDEPLIAALKGLMPVDQQPENDRACVTVPVTR